MIYAAQNINNNDRMNSSSGAVFPILAKNIILSGGIVYGAAFNSNFEVEHIAVDNSDDLPKLYGSKYAYSYCRVFNDVRAYLEEGRKVLFSGTPCQIAGLHTYLKKGYGNLLLIDSVCHGTPSQKTWNDYLTEMSEGKKIRSVNFRDKSKGWRHYRFVIKFEDGSEYNIDHDKDPYMRGFIDNLTLRNACYHCPFKGIDNRISDITLGDFWGIWDLKPELYDDTGTSLLLVNTQKGIDIIEGIREDVKLTEIQGDKFVYFNRAIVEAAKPAFYRDAFISAYNRTGKIIPALKKYATPNAFLRAYRKIRTR